MQHSLIALVIGFILDWMFGDPSYAWHPIRIIGMLIAFLDKRLRPFCKKKKTMEVLFGGLLVVLVLVISVGVPSMLLWIAYRIQPVAGLVIESIFCYQLLATKSLEVESKKVYEALKTKGLLEGRAAVSMIVGRDTLHLSEEGVVKATVETIAENTSDGSIAPLFYMILGGAPFGFFYKAVNTMDSMLGYKNENYLYFGRVAAKLDDLVNFIPARISAFLMILATIFTGDDTKNALHIWKRDRFRHASPNSAQTEAVMAGALDVELAGDAYYFGKKYEKPTIGDKKRDITVEDILRAIKLLRWTALLAMLFLCVLKGLLLFVV